jgi:hypothetical protein
LCHFPRNWNSILATLKVCVWSILHQPLGVMSFVIFSRENKDRPVSAITKFLI